MSRFKYGFNILTNRKTFRDLKESSPLRKLLEGIRSELAGVTSQVSDENIGDGDGSTTDFSGILSEPGVKPGTLIIYAAVSGGTETFTDKGDGTLVSDDGGSGTISYPSGKYSVSFNTAPGLGADIYAGYVGSFTVYKSVGSEDIGDGNGVNKAFSGTLAHPGIKTGSLIIQAEVVGGGAETFSDNGDGTLTSDATPAGSGTIDYSSGDFSVTFTNAPADGEDVLASYAGSFLHYQFSADGLNSIYDARFINYAWGEYLDYWGETLELPRNYSGNAMESDASYRSRLLNELRDFTENLTEKGIRDRVNAIIGSYPTVIEHYTLAPDWPVDWSDASSNFSTWVPWDELVDFLLVVPTGLTASEISQIADAVTDVKFACARCLVVTDSGSGYYDLVKLVE